MRRICWYLPACLLGGCSYPPVSDTSPPLLSVIETRKPILKTGDLENLVVSDPVAFLEQCLDRVDRHIHAYTATLVKQERLQGKLGAEEEILVTFRESPFSVLMEWKRGHRLARKTLFVDGQYNNEIIVQLAGWRAIIGQVTCPVDDEDARATSRFPINEFGMKKGMERTLQAWKASRERGELRVSFRGLQAIPELEGRTCWVVHRVDLPQRDPEGIVDSTYYFDPETGLQVGTVLRDQHGDLIGSYFFRNLCLNPILEETAFCRERMKKH